MATPWPQGLPASSDAPQDRGAPWPDFDMTAL